MDERLQLYKITLRGLYRNTVGITEGISYVVAENPYAAYLKVRKRLDDNDIGFEKERELEKIELLADTYEYNNVGTLLYL